MENIINSLKNLGLNRYEAQAYLGLNKIISGKAEDIAEVSNIPRSRIYDVLNDLADKGFVEIKRGRPLKYTVVRPNIIVKQKKHILINELDVIENKLEDIYNDQISEVQAPVWLIHSNDKIIKKERAIVKKSKKSITIRAGFLLDGEAEMLIEEFKRLPNIKIKIIANSKCYVDNNEIEIYTKFKNSNLTNLEIINEDIPMIKFLIRDGEELFGTFANFEGSLNSIISSTAVGVCNQYADICENLNYHFLKQFSKINKSYL